MQTANSSRRLTRVLVTALVAAGVAAGPAMATPQQKAASAPQKPAAAGGPSAQTGAPPTSRPPIGTIQEAGYSYRPEGRRDPFVSLVKGPGSAFESQARRQEGLAGVLAAELTLKGILYSRGAYIAMVQGPDTRTYIARQNDRLADGTIRAITADSLVILQEVNDPLSLTKQREVAKTLRALEGVK